MLIENRRKTVEELADLLLRTISSTLGRLFRASQ